jgi:hypothetical protein
MGVAHSPSARGRERGDLRYRAPPPVQAHLHPWPQIGCKSSFVPFLDPLSSLLIAVRIVRANPAYKMLLLETADLDADRIPLRQMLLPKPKEAERWAKILLQVCIKRRIFWDGPQSICWCECRKFETALTPYTKGCFITNPYLRWCEALLYNPKQNEILKPLKNFSLCTLKEHGNKVLLSILPRRLRGALSRSKDASKPKLKCLSEIIVKALKNYTALKVPSKNGAFKWGDALKSSHC